MEKTALDFLGRFCAWFGQLIEPANNVRLAIRADDPAALNDPYIIFKSATDRFSDEFRAVTEFSAKEREWWFEYQAWFHGSRHGDKPSYPAWPKNIPEFREALQVVEGFNNLCKYALSPICGARALSPPDSSPVVIPGMPKPPEITPDMREFPFGSTLASVIENLNSLLSLIEIENERGRDGPIDRNALAKLVNVSSKTLANRASELPKPIARTSKDVPIYLYQPAKRALKEMYPDRAGTLPDTYQEAASRPE
jgi:hypothetical protein